MSRRQISAANDFRRPAVRLAGIVLFASFILAGCKSLQTIQEERRADFGRAIERREAPFSIPVGSRVDSVVADVVNTQLTVYLSKEFSHEAFRPENVRKVYETVRAHFGEAYMGYTISVRTLGMPIEELIPNFYRPDSVRYDIRRLAPIEVRRPAPVVTNVSSLSRPVAGLSNRTIVLWHSHGWYYNYKEDRWEWQRPRLFQTVEDRVPMSFTLPYLIPMLERAGAMVFVPRERDTQTHEVITDNDSPAGSYSESSSPPGRTWERRPGFAVGTPPYHTNDNPFVQGTSRTVTAESTATATASWIPDIPETADYSVSIAYASSPENVTDAHYTVFHAGGRTEFLVNQQIGGGTWIPLGKFTFLRGYRPATGRVVLNNSSAQTPFRVSADAVKFGGGVGVVERNGHTSGRPKYLEGARYYLQFAGMPDTLVYSLNGNTNDYRDDFQSRGEYVNYLHGAPFGPNKNRMTPGLGIPVDVSLAFHTDAGITHNDTTVGTLSIYSVEGFDSLRVFPDGSSRFANRDLADLVQTQIVDDLRTLWDPAWTRRQLRNADYGEAVRPNVPSVLLELLSHQNFLDMQFMLDPRFRFDVARAIYKAILRFVATQHRQPAVVQPLPPTHFAAEFPGSGSVTLRWKPQFDPLESSAGPARYVVYSRIGEGGFDNGIAVADTTLVIHRLKSGQLTSFKVAAVNAGGESFPSEILTVCWMENGRTPVLVVNGFDRICGPGRVTTPSFAGFLEETDEGVPDRQDFSFIGVQHDFDPASVYRTNDAPGHGASYAEFETRIRAGNSFDYPAVHGAALMQCGVPFVSCSDEAVTDGMVSLKGYRFVDLILGKERATPWQRASMDSIRGVPYEAFSPPMRSAIADFLAGGGNLFVSGAYVATDLAASAAKDSSARLFARNVLHSSWVTDHAARNGMVVCTDTSFLPYGTELLFNTGFDERVYTVESPDAVGPSEGSRTILRFAENLFSAAVGFRGNHGVVVAGFPFESVIEPGARFLLMQSVLRYFRML